MDPVLEKLKEHLVTKNVAIEIATKLCDSVSSKLEGKVVFFTKNIIIKQLKFFFSHFYRFLVHLNQWHQQLRIP